jgi:hypothetical protein
LARRKSSPSFAAFEAFWGAATSGEQAAGDQCRAVGLRRQPAYPASMTQDPLQARFERVDGDQNGVIDEGEFALLLDALGVGYGDAQVRAAFIAIDSDANGAIELEEFRAWWTSR